MGNSLQTVSPINKVHLPNYHMQLGSYAAIDVTTTEVEGEEEYGEKLKVKLNVSYTVDGSRCNLEFVRSLGNNRQVNSANFALHDDICLGGGIHFWIDKAETDHYFEVGCVTFCSSFPSMALRKTNKTIHSWGGVTETTAFVYGNGSKGGLVVLEWKKKSGDEMPYMGTVAHYYATLGGNYFGQTKLDIGLSVVIKVQVSNDEDEGLDTTVEGPTQHPAAALFYMFDEVKRIGIWKPTMCPHCANIQKKQRAGMYWQSESEDSDSLPPPPLHLYGHRRNARSVLTNDGAVWGNNNGNFIVRQLFLRA